LGKANIVNYLGNWTIKGGILEVRKGVMGGKKWLDGVNRAALILDLKKIYWMG